MTADGSRKGQQQYKQFSKYCHSDLAAFSDEESFWNRHCTPIHTDKMKAFFWRTNQGVAKYSLTPLNIFL